MTGFQRGINLILQSNIHILLILKCKQFLRTPYSHSGGNHILNNRPNYINSSNSLLPNKGVSPIIRMCLTIMRIQEMWDQWIKRTPLLALALLEHQHVETS